jgi:hypothetical protein
MPSEKPVTRRSEMLTFLTGLVKSGLKFASTAPNTQKPSTEAGLVGVAGLLQCQRDNRYRSAYRGVCIAVQGYLAEMVSLSVIAFCRLERKVLSCG